jgi:hypothetical protein
MGIAEHLCHDYNSLLPVHVYEFYNVFRRVYEH